VLKLDSPEIVHKTEAGGVVLGLGDLETVQHAYRTLRDRAPAGASFLLMEQKPAGRELIVGASAAPGLGTLVMFGLGGIFVEVMKDVVFGIAPLCATEARQMMRMIKAAPVLEGVRGAPALNLGAIEEILLRVSRLCADFPEIVELDLNPILAYPGTQSPVVVDVRLKIR
jgi:acetyltransferase